MRPQTHQNQLKNTLSLSLSLSHAVRAGELQRDVAVMKETFQRKVDCKNALVQSLARDIEEAEEQYRVTLRRHLVKLDEMVGFQQRRVRNLEREYDEELEALRAEFDKERLANSTLLYTLCGYVNTHSHTHTLSHTQGGRWWSNTRQR